MEGVRFNRWPRMVCPDPGPGGRDRDWCVNSMTPPCCSMFKEWVWVWSSWSKEGDRLMEEFSRTPGSGKLAKANDPPSTG